MKRLAAAMIAGGLAAWWVCGPISAGEPGLSVDTVIAKWEETSRKYRTIDAKATVLQYSSENDSQPSVGKTRLYHEAPDFTRWEMLGPSNRRRDDLAAVPATIVWMREGVYFGMDPTEKTVGFASAAKLIAARRAWEKMPEGTGWERFMKDVARVPHWIAFLATPDDMLPWVVNADMRSQRARFDFRAAMHDRKILLEAVAKPPERRLRSISLLLEPGTYRLAAHQVVYASGQKVVYVFEEFAIDRPAADRATLLQPVPLGYRRIDLDEPMGHRSDKSKPRDDAGKKTQ